MSHVHGNPIVEVKNVSFRYGAQPVLENIDLTIYEGDYLGIIGPNGGGKTTLLKIILGLLTPGSGNVCWFGADIAELKDRSKIGYVPQRAIHFDTQFPATVREVVDMGCRSSRGISRLWKRRDDRLIEESLAKVDMLEYKDRLIGELSSGQQQRVFIARALVSQPSIILLDEPTVGVDVQAQEQFYALLKTLNEKHKLTLVLVSHDIDVVASQVSEIACVNSRLVCHVTPHEFDASSYIKELYGKDIKFIVHDH